MGCDSSIGVSVNVTAHVVPKYFNEGFYLKIPIYTYCYTFYMEMVSARITTLRLRDKKGCALVMCDSKTVLHQI